jgi:hypothetical protein
MAKDRPDFAQESTQQAMQAASFGANWMSEMADYHLKQSMATMEGMLTIFRKAADAFGQQASAMREQSLALAEEAMANAADFGNKIVRIKDPREWAEAQSEFLSRQAQTLAEGNKKLSETLIQESKEVANNAFQQAREISRKRSEAA